MALKDWKKYIGQLQWKNKYSGERITVGRTSDNYWLVSVKHDFEHSFFNMSKKLSTKPKALELAKQYMRSH